jgi:hypothetical protein
MIFYLSFFIGDIIILVILYGDKKGGQKHDAVPEEEHEKVRQTAGKKICLIF